MRSAIALVLSAVVVAACYDDGVTYPSSTPATVTVSVTSTDPMTSRGDTRLLSAVVKAADGSVLPAQAVTWQTSATSVATVSASGASATITAVDDGTAIISAKSGNAEGTITVTVRRKLVELVLSGPDSIIAGDSAQLVVIGRDARQQEMPLPDVHFASTNPFSVLVFPNGMANAVFSSFNPKSSTVSALVTRDGSTLIAQKLIRVASPAPAGFHLAALMIPEAVRPEPVIAIGEGVIFLTLDAGRVNFKMLWSWLTTRPTSAHLHGPDGSDSVADVLVELPLGDQTSSFGVRTSSFGAADIRGRAGSPPISVDSLVKLIEGGRVYADVHTAQFVDGEVRGSVFRFR